MDQVAALRWCLWLLLLTLTLEEHVVVVGGAGVATDARGVDRLRCVARWDQAEVMRAPDAHDGAEGHQLRCRRALLYDGRAAGAQRRQRVRRRQHAALDGQHRGARARRDAHLPARMQREHAVAALHVRRCQLHTYKSTSSRADVRRESIAIARAEESIL